MNDQEFDYYENSVTGNRKKSQLDLYLEEPRLNRKQYAKLNVLSWWKQNDNRFSELSLMARDLLSILITTVASELFLALEVKFLISIDHVFCQRMWKL